MSLTCYQFLADQFEMSLEELYIKVTNEHLPLWVRKIIPDRLSGILDPKPVSSEWRQFVKVGEDQAETVKVASLTKISMKYRLVSQGGVVVRSWNSIPATRARLCPGKNHKKYQKPPRVPLKTANCKTFYDVKKETWPLFFRTPYIWIGLTFSTTVQNVEFESKFGTDSPTEYCGIKLGQMQLHSNQGINTQIQSSFNCILRNHFSVFKISKV